MKTWLIIVSVVAVLLAIGAGVSFSMLNPARAELADTKAELAVTEAALADTTAELADAKSDLAEIEEVYPPRNFQDKFELTSWREETGIVGAGLSYVDACLRLQEIGLSGGYILSIDVDVDAYGQYVSLTVIAGENFYIVTPDDLAVYLIGLVY